MKRVAIIGGGIAGLSAAWTLEKARRAGEPVEYHLFENASRLGGVISSETIDGCVVEGGPDSFLTEKPAAAALCRELGLADQLLPSNDGGERRTWIVVKNRLIPLPDGLMFMVPTKLIPTALTRLFSWSTKLRMAREYLFPPAPATEDESVADMTRRHFGQETVDRLVRAPLSGDYGATPPNSVSALCCLAWSPWRKNMAASRAPCSPRAKFPRRLANPPHLDHSSLRFAMA